MLGTARGSWSAWKWSAPETSTAARAVHCAASAHRRLLGDAAAAQVCRNGRPDRPCGQVERRLAEEPTGRVAPRASRSGLDVALGQRALRRREPGYDDGAVVLGPLSVVLRPHREGDGGAPDVPGAGEDHLVGAVLAEGVDGIRDHLESVSVIAVADLARGRAAAETIARLQVEPLALAVDGSAAS